MASRLGEEKSDAGKFQRPKVRPVTFRRVRLDVGEERELLEDFYRVWGAALALVALGVLLLELVAIDLAGVRTS